MNDRAGDRGPSNMDDAANVNIEDDTQDMNQEPEQNGNAAPSQEDDLAAQYLDALQRERASFINYKRRTEQERAESVQYASAALVKKLLPVVDDFDRALASIPEAERKNNKWVEGVQLIDRKLHNILEQEGVEPIEAMGQPFDPNLHEAVAFEDNTQNGKTEQPDTVSEVFSKGYKMHDRVLKPAVVKVTRG